MGLSPNAEYKFFVKSSDTAVVCGPTIEVNVRANSASAYKQGPDLSDYRAVAGYTSEIMCDRRGKTTKVYFTLFAGEQIVRKVWFSSSNMYTVPHEELSNPAELRNPSGEKLDTSGLRYQTFCDYIFYGRFDRMRSDDPYRANFAWLYYEFIRQYGDVYNAYLKPPVKTLELTVFKNGIPVRTTRYTMEERVVASFRRNENYRSGISFGDYAGDIEKILERHNAANSQALALFYENLYRYASDLPSVQERPQLSSTTGPKPVPVSGRTPGARTPRSSLSKAIERSLRDRAVVAIPDEIFISTANSMAERFQNVPLEPKYREGWTSGTGEQEKFLLARISNLIDGSSSLVDSATKEALERFRDETISSDPLLFSALNCVFCLEPKRNLDDRPPGFAKRFLSPRANGSGALSDETLMDPKRFVGLRYVSLDQRVKWRRELPASIDGKLLVCEYLPEDGSMISRSLRVYWYHATPPNWEQLRRSLSLSHPLIAEVGTPRDACPTRR